MEQKIDNLNSDINFTEIKYENLSFLGRKPQRSCINKIDKTPNLYSSLNNITFPLNSNTKNLRNNSKSEEVKKLRITDEKWGLVNRTFQIILESGEMINLEIEKINEIIKTIESSVVVRKGDISIQTIIDEATTLDIFLCEILSFLKNALSSKEDIVEELELTDPFMTVLDELYGGKGKGLRKFIAPLFKGENTEKNELLKILKIDYFQKCINDRTFSSKCLLKILKLKEDDLYTLDLNHICLPFIENKRLITYAQFMTKIFESESFLQAMFITMNFQSKGIAYTKENIRKSMTEICEYLLYPVVFPNEEESKLYAVTCINLKLYLSSFVVKNLEDKKKRVYLTLKKRDDLQKIDGLKKRILLTVSVGFEFAVLILTIIHESSHILRRHLIEPKVYINTEEVEKDSLIEKINDTSDEKEKESETEHLHHKMSEGGDILEYLLFGENFKGLISQEIKFLFNLDNWNKSLKNFREDFTNIRKLMDHNCTKSRQFMSKFNEFSFLNFCGNKRYKPCC